MVINSVEKFLEHLGVGDTFWHMGSYCAKPSGVNGPCTILALFQDGAGDWRIRWRNEETGYESPANMTRFVSDLVNRWHGVFLDRKSADAYFAERKHAYETNPALIKEHEEALEWSVLDWSVYEPLDDSFKDEL